MKILKRRHPHPEIPLVSTADVSFLLLIFFLSTTIFATQRGISLELPRPGERVLEVPASKTMHVAVLEDQSILLDDVVVPLEALAGSVRLKLRDDPDFLVRLTVVPRAPYAAFVRALDQVKLAGARRVSIQSGSAP